VATLPSHFYRQSTVQDAVELLAEPSASINKSLPIHRWTNWIAGFSGEFARTLIQEYVPSPTQDSLVVDPFAGVGTTLVESHRHGVHSVGFEINPFAALVCSVKLSAPYLHVPSLQAAIVRYGWQMQTIDEANGNGTHPIAVKPKGFKSRVPFLSPKVETKVLYTLDFIAELDASLQDIFRVALASVLVEISNYSYEPSLASREAAGKETILDARVGDIVSKKLVQMAEDIVELQARTSIRAQDIQAQLHPESFFDAEHHLQHASVDLIVTSPPYMNNYHYVRNTRPQLFWTDLVTSSSDLKDLEEKNFGKYWQTVRARKPIELDFAMTELEEEIGALRQLNTDKGVYGGNGWANYVTSYMNDLYRFCGLLATFLRPRGVAAIVIGNSVIQGRDVAVDQHLSHIAELHGLTTIDNIKARSRVGSSIVNSGLRTVGRQKPTLYDAVVLLQQPH
jgi:hypothetical protein